ncbi:MAG: MFS transporter [Acetobacteraceae bacterium]|nr:MFS transporter [Acetobacteraceae bacterium]
MSADFGWGAAASGIALSGFFWSYAIGNVVVGPLVDRLEPRRAQTVGALFWCVCLVATSVAQSFAVLLGSRVLLGVAESPSQPIAVRSIRTFFREETIGSACVLGVALPVRCGPIVAFLAGGILVEYLGWRGTFLVLALVSLVAIPCWLSLYPGTSATIGREPSRV